MRITHVIRAEEHLPNTPIQVLLHEALGNVLPVFAHIPYVAAPGSKEKLSKRESKLEKYRKSPAFKAMFEAADRVFPRVGLGSSETLNPVMVEYYERIGYLPAAVLNALARLGWSLDDRTEIMSLDTVVEHFTLERVIKSPAGFDPDKLDSYQLHWMGTLSLEEKVAGCWPFLVQGGLAPGDSRQHVPGSKDPGSRIEDRGSPVGTSTREYVARVIAVLGERLKIFSDILSFDEFFVPDEALSYDEKAFDKRIRKPSEALPLLRTFREHLADVSPFETATLERLMHDVAESAGAKLGDIIHAVRVAVTGKPAGAGMFETLELLGRERCLSRLDRALSRI
jgi:glutamyl-tRNA synthetase